MKLLQNTASFALLAFPSWALAAPQASSAPSSARSASPAASSSPPGGGGGLRGSDALLGYSSGNKIPTQPSTEIPPDQFELAPGQDAPEKLGFYLDITKVKNPQPLRGDTKKPTDPGPRTYEYDRLNSDLFIPPGTDSGDVHNEKWPFGLSHNRHGLAGAGWARQQNEDQLPIAKAMAGVNMRLSPHAYRELHWHRAGEWALMLNGSVRVQAVNEDGQTFVDDVTAGDVWFFPPGIPHSIQAFENGCEFLLVFNDGSFSEDNTFMLSELMLRNPQSVVAKNFRTNTNALKNIPQNQLWIFNGTAAPKNIQEQNITGPAGIIPHSAAYTYHFSEQKPYEVEGGSVKILDPQTFPIAKGFSTALVTVKPGAMRELHWHISSDEWTYFLAGSARLTSYQAPASSRTFDFTAGDVGYIPFPNAHYLENTGDTDLIFLEVLQAERFTDISVNQWLGLTPKQIVKDHLNVDDAFYNNLPKTEPLIVPGDKNLLQTNFTKPKLTASKFTA